MLNFKKIYKKLFKPTNYCFSVESLIGWHQICKNKVNNHEAKCASLKIMLMYFKKHLKNILRLIFKIPYFLNSSSEKQENVETNDVKAKSVFYIFQSLSA